MFDKKKTRLDSNCGPPMSEATAPPTEPQPLPCRDKSFLVPTPNLVDAMMVALPKHLGPPSSQQEVSIIHISTVI